MILRKEDALAVMKSIEKNLEYPRHDQKEELNLDYQAQRIWKAIMERVLILAKAEILRGREVAEIEERHEKEKVLVIYRKKCGEDFKSFAVPKELCYNQIIARMAIIAEPYGFKISPSKKAVGSGKWSIEFVR